MISGLRARARLDRWRAARVATVALVAVVALVAASCSDSGDSADPVEDTTTTAVEQPEETLELEVEAEADDTVEETGGSQAQESEPEELGAEFIELPYWETFFIEGIGRTQQADEECDRPEPEVVECEYELTGSMVATHIGRATEVQTGTVTTFLAETCAGGVRRVEDGSGTITSEWGDELHFRVRTTCRQVNWVLEGGTGRFLDATGRMSGFLLPPIEGVGAVNSGTLTVRADLWADVLPPAID